MCICFRCGEEHEVAYVTCESCGEDYCVFSYQEMADILNDLYIRNIISKDDIRGLEE